MKKYLITVIFLFTSMGYSLVEKREFNAKGLEDLKIKNSSGDINISVTKDTMVHVSANKVNFDKNCELKISRTNDELVIEVEKKGFFKTGDCKVHLVIQVPKKLAMELKSGSGQLNINGTQGEIDFSLGSGDAVIHADVEKLEGKSGSGSVKVSGTVGETDIKAGSGSIEISGLTSDGDFKTGSGDLTLTYTQEPKSGELDIKTGSGDATVYFPKTMKVLTNYKSGIGQIYNELGDSNEANFKVYMKAGKGDLKIKKLK